MGLDVEHVVAIDIGGTKVAVGLVAFPAEGAPSVVRRVEIPTCAQEGGERVCSRIEETAREFVAGLSPEERASLKGVGVGSAGVVDPGTGSIRYANDLMPGWGGIALGSRLEQVCGLPVAVLGDVQAHALCEALWGAGKGAGSVLCIAVGTGIGGAFVEDGKVMRGSRGAAGHMGHIASPSASGMPCACGRTGHLECVASGTALGAVFEGRYGRVREGEPVTGKLVNELAAAGDERAVEVVREAGIALGVAAGSLTNILDPDVIVFSGGAGCGGDGWRSDVWRDAIAEGFAGEAIDPLADTPMTFASFGGDAPLVGAAEFLRKSL